MSRWVQRGEEIRRDILGNEDTAGLRIRSQILFVVLNPLYCYTQLECRKMIAVEKVHLPCVQMKSAWNQRGICE